MDDLKVRDIRQAIAQLKRRESLRKSVKFYKMPIRNWEFFEKMRKAGKVYEVRPGLWELKK